MSTQPSSASAGTTPAAARPDAPHSAGSATDGTHLGKLNPQQRRAVLYGLSEPAGNRQHTGVGNVPAIPPLLIIAGAGTGKTTTLAHRVAECVLHGSDPARILLLTFTRRAAKEMTRRAERIVALAARSDQGRGRIVSGSLRWAGTFHAIANRLLRLYAPSLALDPSFTVLDRSDAEDLLDVVRHRTGLSRRKKRFPRKATCLAIYSRCVNSGARLKQVLDEAFPWCGEWEEELRELFRGYVDAKQGRAVLDYDDLLLYWFHLMQEPTLARKVSSRFDHVLVDEYQDTNALQASILLALRPDGDGLTVVGDDAQAIYAFRAATVRNILDFPDQFEPAARVITLEQNYRSTQTILDAANAVIGFAAERFTKDLFSARPSRQKPRLVTVEDESDQAQYIVERVLAAREAGLALQDQAVLFRTVHHSDLLQIELSHRNIPFVMYGGLRFLEAAHVKDLLCVLRWAENPRDGVAAFRTLQLFAGIGPAAAQNILDSVSGESSGGPVSGGSHALPLPNARPTAGLRLADVEPPAAARADWPAFVELMERLAAPDCAWPGQVGEARRWYEPHLERLYDAPMVRGGDLEQIELIAGQYPSRERFLAEVTIDPPSASGDLAGPPHRDEDFLVLSTIHSAKGQEWDHVYVMNLVDGCIPSDMSTGSVEEIEEERRLLYVAMTRARNELHLIHPLRFYTHRQSRRGDRHVYAPRSRFLPGVIADRFEITCRGGAAADPADGGRGGVRVDVAARLRSMW
ncbi:MAG: ATP-dependent helicase [Acidobacteriota bacterium]|jgi:DNA helicase-2/ATP-dependent DNA helicase PcrA